MDDGSTPAKGRSDAARNRVSLLAAATAAVHREGPRVPMATIAAEAGVGIGTLYRHFPTREDLLDQLTLRSFEQVLANAEAAEREGTTALDALRRFVEAAIVRRNELVLPLHGGPPVRTAQGRAIRGQVHDTIARILARGQAEQSLRADVTPQDIVVLGSMLAQPRPADEGYDAMCRRLLATYLNGLVGPG